MVFVFAELSSIMLIYLPFLLKVIWDEVGESDDERDKMLLQLEQECLDVYKRKVEQAAKSRAHFIQKLADSKEELSRLLSALGEPAYTENVSATILGTSLLA